MRRERGISVRVPAKVNLFLAVRGRRADGYHELVTVMQTVAIHDALRAAIVWPAGRGDHPAGRRRMRLVLRQDAAAGLPAGRDNLAMRAAEALGRSSQVVDLVPSVAGSGPETVLQLDKGIPVAGGMAGGSADAAAALVGLNELWGCKLSREALRDLGAELGSDVPFCVIGGTALATGSGTSLARVLCRGTFHWLVCTAVRPLATPDVYRAWDRGCRPTEVEPDAVLAALRGQDAVALGAALYNELEAAAFALRPELAERKQELLDSGALGVVMAGSGPTLLALVADDSAAERIAAQHRPHFRDVLAAQSPAGGPELRERRS